MGFHEQSLPTGWRALSGVLSPVCLGGERDWGTVGCTLEERRGRRVQHTTTGLSTNTQHSPSFPEKEFLPLSEWMKEWIKCNWKLENYFGGESNDCSSQSWSSLKTKAQKNHHESCTQIKVNSIFKLLNLRHTSYLSFFLHNRNLRPRNFTLESA